MGDTGKRDQQAVSKRSQQKSKKAIHQCVYCSPSSSNRDGERALYFEQGCQLAMHLDCMEERVFTCLRARNAFPTCICGARLPSDGLYHLSTFAQERDDVIQISTDTEGREKWDVFHHLNTKYFEKFPEDVQAQFTEQIEDCPPWTQIWIQSTVSFSGAYETAILAKPFGWNPSTGNKGTKAIGGCEIVDNSVSNRRPDMPISPSTVIETLATVTDANLELEQHWAIWRFYQLTPESVDFFLEDCRHAKMSTLQQNAEPMDLWLFVVDVPEMNKRFGCYSLMFPEEVDLASIIDGNFTWISEVE